MLRVQAGQLRVLRAQYAQDEADRRSSQASQIVLWSHPPRCWGQPGAAPGKPGTYERVMVHIENTSQQPVYDLYIDWRQSDERWPRPDYHRILRPGDPGTFPRDLPRDLPPAVTRSAYTAEIVFRDRNQVWWRLWPDGRFKELVARRHAL